MKTLIRTLLFIAARTGLFLAVVVWTVGQWWSADITVSYRGRGFLTGVAPSCILIETPAWIGNRISVGVFPADRADEERFLSGAFFEQTWQIPGASFSRAGQLNWLILHHWLVVALLVVFNAILHFIYRRNTRTESVPCELP